MAKRSGDDIKGGLIISWGLYLAGRIFLTFGSSAESDPSTEMMWQTIVSIIGYIAIGLTVAMWWRYSADRRKNDKPNTEAIASEDKVEAYSVESFRRKTRVLPLVLSSALVVSYLIGFAFSVDPVTSKTLIDDLGAIFIIWLFDLPFTYIPFLALGWVGGLYIKDSHSRFYAANGALIGLSLATLPLWLMAGWQLATVTESGQRDAAYANVGYVLVIGPVTGLLAMSIGALIGILYDRSVRTGSAKDDHRPINDHLP